MSMLEVMDECYKDPEGVNQGIKMALAWGGLGAGTVLCALTGSVLAATEILLVMTKTGMGQIAMATIQLVLR